MTEPAYIALEEKDFLQNPGYLKLDLMLRGMRLEPGVVPALRRLARYSCDFSQSADIDLILPEETWVSVPARSRGDASPYALTAQRERFFVESPHGSVEVKLIPPTRWAERRTPAGTPLLDVGTLRGGYLALSPLRTCQLILDKLACSFCSAVARPPSAEATLPPSSTPATALRLVRTDHSVDDVVEAVHIAREDGPVSVVYLSFGMTNTPDRGISLLEPYVRALKRQFDVLVGVDIVPPAENDWVDRTYAMGVDTIAYNLEVYDPDTFARVCPGLARAVGRDRYLDALTYATTVFPRGAVTSNLIVGIEPPESTMVGIEDLAGRGVVPVLPLLRPFKGVDLPAPQPLAVRDVAPIYGQLYHAVKRHRLPTKWVRNLSVVATPIEARFFVGGEARLEGFLRAWYRTRLGARTSAKLADLRRALRVKEVRESLDSSGL